MTGGKRGRLKERHHWWPECVSKHWCEADGQINAIRSTGQTFRAPPSNVGVIGNGHIIKLGRGRPSPWDESFEHVFDAADSSFPAVLKWLDGLEREWRPTAKPRSSRYMAQPDPGPMFGQAIECMVSLAVRSPKFRAASVGVALRLRGPLPADEQHNLEAMNMRHCQRMIADACKSGGKMAVIYAKEGEFIFGDGFFNTATAVSGPPHSPKMLVPLTPKISVLYARPMTFATEPRLVTLVLDEAEVASLNDVVQIYSKDQIFWRSSPPVVTEDFRKGAHLVFADRNNVVDGLIGDIPGVRGGHPLLFSDY